MATPYIPQSMMAQTEVNLTAGVTGSVLLTTDFVTYCLLVYSFFPVFCTIMSLNEK